MWTKTDYEEHMLGYLDTVRIEIESRAHIQHQDLKEFYTILDTALECLWKLIEANNINWENYRYPLEAQCDELLHMFYNLTYTYFSSLSTFESALDSIRSFTSIETTIN